MGKSTWIVIGALIGIPICVGLILIAIYPHRPNDLFGWTALILLAAPIVFGLEFIGTSLLQNKIVARMGRLTRIIYGVVVIVLISILIWLIWRWIGPHFGTWN
jgi:hypothetical protein